MKKQIITGLLLAGLISAGAVINISADSRVSGIKSYILLDESKTEETYDLDTNGDGIVNVFDACRIKQAIIYNKPAVTSVSTDKVTSVTTTLAKPVVTSVSTTKVTSAATTSAKPVVTSVSTTKAPPVTTASQSGSQQLSQENVYNAMIALKKDYPEGMSWTNDNSYTWKGGVFRVGYGCVGFAFILSDAAFGDLPARKIDNYPIADIRVGDILRVNNNTHSVVVLEINDNGITIAEGNYNRSIHWGRKLAWSDIQNDISYVLTRYPN